MYFSIFFFSLFPHFKFHTLSASNIQTVIRIHMYVCGGQHPFLSFSISHFFALFLFLSRLIDRSFLPLVYADFRWPFQPQNAIPAGSVSASLNVGERSNLNPSSISILFDQYKLQSNLASVVLSFFLFLSQLFLSLSPSFFSSLILKNSLYFPLYSFTISHFPHTLCVPASSSG